MKTTNEVKTFIRLRNIIVAALLAIILTLAGCAGNAAIDLAPADVTIAPNETAAASADATQAAIDESATPATEEPAAAQQPEASVGPEETAQSAFGNRATAKPAATPAATVKPAPTVAATAKPTAGATVKPTAAPTAKPTATVQPTVKPTVTPTAKPTAKPTATAKATNPLFGNFSAKDVKGNTVTNSVFSGYDVTMVNIWASYCGPCAKEMPDLAALNDEYRSQGFQVVGIILDAADSSGNVDNSALSDAKSVINSTGADYTHIIPSASMFSKYLNRVSSVPTTVFVNSDGEIIGSAYVGSKSKSQWASIIEQKLG